MRVFPLAGRPHGPGLQCQEDSHNFTWGRDRLQSLDASRRQGQPALDATLADLGRADRDSHTARRDRLAITVLNPHCSAADPTWPPTGRIYPLPAGTKGARRQGPRRQGRAVADRAEFKGPARWQPDRRGGRFPRPRGAHAGYDTYYLDFVPEAASPAASDLKIDEAKLTLENEHLRVRLAPDTGGIVSLVDKASGREMLDAAQGPFPRLTGRPNLAVAKLMHREPPEFYDMRKSKAAIDWLAKGPVRAEVRAQHAMPELRFETRISLAAGAVRRNLQPHVDAGAAQAGRASGRHQGGLLVLADAFLPGATLLRNYPFGVEPTKNPTSTP